MKAGGTGLNKDITLRMKKYHYMAPLGLRLVGLKEDPRKSELVVNYPDPQDGSLKSEELELYAFGHFVSDGDKRPVFPVGLRSITARIRHRNEEEEKVIVFPIQPGMNYIGIIE